jgi:hypothetical protein
MLSHFCWPSSAVDGGPSFPEALNLLCLVAIRDGRVLVISKQ